MSAARNRWPMRVCLLLLLWGAPVEAQTPWVGTLWGDTYSFVADGDRATVRVPLRLQGNVALDTLELLAVRSGLEYDDAHFDALTLGLERGGLPTALITLDLSHYDRPDTLNVLVRAVRSGGDPVDLTLNLIRPAAAVRDPGTIHITRITGALFGGDRDPELRLRETSGRSRISAPELRAVRFSSEAEPHVELSLEGVLDSVGFISPRDAETLTYVLQGPIPNGTTTGSAELTAPELGAPVEIQFEITKRPTLALLAGIILLGLLAGFYVRVEQERVKELAKARAAAEPLVRQLTQLTSRYAETSFRDFLAEQSQALQHATDGSGADAVDARIAEIRTAVETKLADLKSRLETQDGRRRAWAELVGRAWSLPPALLRLVETVGRLDEDLRAGLERGAASDVSGALDEMEREVAQGLGTAFEGWRARMTGLYEALLDESLPFPRSVLEQERAEIEALSGQLDALPTPPQKGTPESVEPLLSAAHTHGIAALGVYRSLVRGLGRLEARLAHDLAPLPDSDSWAVLRSSLDPLRDSAGSQEKLEEGFSLLVERDRWTRWEEGLGAQARDPGSAELAKALAEGRYVDAAAIIGQQRATADMPLGDDISARRGVAAEPGTPELPASALPVVQAGGPVHAARAAALPQVTATEAVRAVAARSRKEIRRANAIQFMASALLITAIGVVILGDAYAGSMAQHVGAFFWGFTLDIALGTVLEKAGALPGMSG